MAGLMVKDFRLLLQRKQSLFVFLVIGIMLSFSQSSSIFVIGYLTFVSFTLASGTISYDEFDNGYPFLLTLPITRKTYVLEKYLLCLAVIVVSWIAAVVLCFVMEGILGNPIMVKDTLLVSVAVLPTPIFFMDILIPVQIKYGAERARVVLIAVVGIITLIGYGVMKLLNYMEIGEEELLANIAKIPEFLLALMVIAVTILVTWISIMISYGIMKKKEF
ncbi:MAG: ABC-2 transporter permease [Lachnospiraceae bacterium]